MKSRSISLIKKVLYSPYQDLGLLLVRLGIGVIFMFHGWPSLVGGEQKWQWLGSQLALFGINVFHVGFGLIAAINEFGGGLCLALGLFHRGAALALASTMFVATCFHINRGDAFGATSHALEALILFLALALTGPGKISLDHKLAKN